MILDNLTQFIPGSLNDDAAVSLIYDRLEILSRNNAMAVCVLAHTSEKTGDHGWVSNLPMGSSVIRTRPRWFAYLRRSKGVLEVQLSGNSARPWAMTLTEPTDTPRFEVLGTKTAEELAAQTGQRQRERSQRVLDQNARIRRWLDTHDSMGQVKAAEAMTAELGFNVTQKRVSQVSRMDFSGGLFRYSLFPL